MLNAAVPIEGFEITAILLCAGHPSHSVKQFAGCGWFHDTATETNDKPLLSSVMAIFYSTTFLPARLKRRLLMGSDWYQCLSIEWTMGGEVAVARNTCEFTKKNVIHHLAPIAVGSRAWPLATLIGPGMRRVAAFLPTALATVRVRLDGAPCSRSYPSKGLTFDCRGAAAR